MTQDARTTMALPGDFLVGEWLVQPGLCSMAAPGGRIVKLRPQHVDFIVCLARHPNRTLTKAEILEIVWPGQHIQESGLARCLAEIRQALGDDAQNPRFILTVPKVGYRLIAPVRWVDESPAVDNPREAPVATPAPGDAIRTRLRWPWIAGAIVVVGLAAVFVAWLASRRGPAAEPGAVAVVFENFTRDPSFDGALGLALAVSLEQSPMLGVVPDARVRDELRFMGRSSGEALTRALALEACQRAGAKALVAGTINALGSRYAIGLEAVACQSGTVLARQQVEVNRKEDVLRRLGDAASGIRERLGESIASVRRYEVPIVRATTSSLDALKAVSLGDAERAMGRDAQAIDLYRQAVTIDPDFALAHTRLASHLLNLQRTGEAVQSLESAYAVSAKVSAPERYNITGLYYSRVVRDPFRAIEAFQTWRDVYPRDPLPRMALASLYGQIGRFHEELQEARAAEKLDPNHAIVQAVIVNALLALGRLEEARRVGNELEASGRASANVHLALFQVAFIEGDNEGMRREQELTAGNRSSESVLLRANAAAAACGGRFADARKLWQKTSEAALANGDSTEAALALLENAEAYALVGLTAESSKLVARALATSRAPEALLRAAVVCALSGDAGQARRLVDENVRTESPDPSSDPEWRPLISALIELDRGRADAAIEALRPMQQFEAGGRFRMRPTLVRGLAWLKLNRPADAVGEFQRIVDHRGAVPVDIIYPVAVMHLARALEAAGDHRAAAGARSELETMWRSADAPLVARVGRVGQQPQLP